MVKSLLLSLLLLVVAPAWAATVEETYVLDIDGALTIGVDGSVIDVELNDRAALGAAAADGYEKMIRAWRFEPIVEDGLPVQARARMQLSLEARGDREHLEMGVRSVWFTDADGAVRVPGVAAPVPTLRPPNYPEKAFRQQIGAVVMLLVKIGEDGRVVEVAARDVELLGPAPRTEGISRRIAGWFTAASEKAAREWLFPGFEPGLVVVPVRYHRSRDKHWERSHDVVVDMPTWALAEDAQQLTAGGRPLSTRVRLLSDPTAATPAPGGG